MLSLISFNVSFLADHEPQSNIEKVNAYLIYLNKLLQGDFGISSINNQPIREQLKMAFPATMELCVLAFSLSLLIGIPLGIIAGMTRGKWTDITINVVTLVGFSVPAFWLALLLMLFFSLQLGWLPISGRLDLLYQIKRVTGLALIDTWLSQSPYRKEMMISVIQLLLPITTLAMAAATRGLSRLTIIRRHLLHNALPPIIPKLGLQFSAMLTLAMITEIVFNWPGLGNWLLEAIRQGDYDAISTGVFVIGALVVVINVMCDILSMMTPLKRKEWYAIR
ncbi:putative antimicrobial peptide transporter subunit [Candidatus Regiella insecticola LSR1]|uniref:Putative antimicrobial peptide transporter subunit n=1 Tax=Candidatus Regiella insecticola LSR1 TaxID=663321 RepID=E0WV97_9ENTR|nr:putative antimicrobial peptide transporter subunit [Candidatus Regiella insecticola LSR1]